MTDREAIRHLSGCIWRLLRTAPVNLAQFPKDQMAFDDAERALIDLGLVDTAQREAEIMERTYGG